MSNSSELTSLYGNVFLHALLSLRNLRLLCTFMPQIMNGNVLTIKAENARQEIEALCLELGVKDEQESAQ